MRFAEITKRPRMTDQLARYLPDNYRVLAEDDGTIVIGGEDVAGWTLDGYVLPRLASGLIWGKEVTEEFVRGAAGPLAEAVRAAVWPQGEQEEEEPKPKPKHLVVIEGESETVTKAVAALNHHPDLRAEELDGDDLYALTDALSDELARAQSAGEDVWAERYQRLLGKLEGLESEDEEDEDDPGEFKVAVIDEDTHSVVGTVPDGG